MTNTTHASQNLPDVARKWCLGNFFLFLLAAALCASGVACGVGFVPQPFFFFLRDEGLRSLRAANQGG